MELTTGLLIALMVVSFYFLIIRPNRKRQAAQAQLMQSMTPGARVMLNSGMYATVVDVGDKQVVVELAPGVEVRVVKQAILQVVTPDSQFAEDTSDGAFDGLPVEDEPLEQPVVDDRPAGNKSDPRGDTWPSAAEREAISDDVADPALGEDAGDHDDPRNDQGQKG